MNGAHQPGGNYVSGTVKYNGHTITFKNWGPFGCGSNWVDIRFERSVFTFNYNGGRNYNQNTDNITVDHYWYNANNFSIVDTYNGKNFDIENQPYWAAYMSDFTGYMFDGWWTEATGGTRITPEDITKHKQSMTLYAHWEQFWNVDLVGGSWTTPSRGTIDSYGHHETKVVRGQEMEPVIFTANSGHHIDHNKIAWNVSGGGFDEYTENGVTVERISDTHYVASGTPTGPVTIYIPNGHKYEDWTMNPAATCTTAGAKERVCKYDATIKETAEVAIDPNAHSYKFKDFTWTGNETDGYTAATANYVCEHNSEHTITADATVTNKVTNPTCTEGGKTTYTATVAAEASPDGQEHKESEDAKATEATKHKWKFEGFTWTGDETNGYTAAKANYVCEHDASHTESVDATIGEPVVTEPTCEESGKTTYTATVEATDSIDGEKHTESKDAKPTEAKNHKWKFTEITWTGNDTDGYTAATANYVCEHNSEHTITADATVTNKVTNPTCTEPGKTTYTATVAAADSKDGQTHSASKEIEVSEPLGHDWKFTEFTWTGNETDGYTGAVANYICEREEHDEDESRTTTVDATLNEDVLDPTCTEPGKTTYTATVAAEASPDGQKQEESKDGKATDPIKHKWKFTEFTWTGSEADGYTAAVANYVCENDDSHTETAVATISDPVVTDPTCTEAGKTTYTATVAAADSKDGQEHTESKDAKATDPTDHKWKFEGFTWTGNATDGYTVAKSNYVCEHDASHTTSVDANISDEVTDPTCTEPGKTTYTATIAKADSPDGQKHTESKDAKPTDPLQHDWDKWTQTKAPTCIEQGEEERVCKRDATHRETREVADPNAHKYGDWTEVDDNQHQRVCEHDATHVEKANHSWDAGKVTKTATEQAEGVKTYTCTVCKATKTESIPKLKPSAQKVSGTLLAGMTSKGKTGLNISWNRIQGAAGYDIYFAECNHDGKKFATRNVKTIKGNKTFKWTKSGLRKNTSYKAYVKAYVMKNGKKSYVRTSPVIHAYTTGGDKKYTNPKSVSVKKASVSLKKGKTYSVKGSVAKLKKNKKLIATSHAPKLRYLSSNTGIATVKITAKKAGICIVYTYAANGVSKAVKVTVK